MEMIHLLTLRILKITIHRIQYLASFKCFVHFAICLGESLLLF